MFVLTRRLLKSKSLLICLRRNAFTLRDAVAQKLEAHFKLVRGFKKAYGSTKFHDIELESMYAGMRNMVPMVWEISEIDHQHGVKLRGLSLAECISSLPKEGNSEYPSVESLFWFLLTGDVPNGEQVKEIQTEFSGPRAQLPELAHKLLRGGFAKDLLPMSRLIAIITLLTMESHQRKAYGTVKKSEYWKFALEDALDLVARMPEIVALCYRFTYFGEAAADRVEPGTYWASNFTKMLGVKAQIFTEFVKLIVLCHADHDGANVCTHTTHLVSSALTDPYLALSAGFCGLAGPAEGLVIKEALAFIEKAHSQIGDGLEASKINDFILKHIREGRQIPGFGHAVLKKPDPRYILQLEFGKKHLANDPLFKCAEAISLLAPPIISELKSIRCPYPNTDLLTGVFLKHFGVKESDFYTLFIALARVLGATAGFVWDRGLGVPIERPKSFSTIYMQKNFVKPDII